MREKKCGWRHVGRLDGFPRGSKGQEIGLKREGRSEKLDGGLLACTVIELNHGVGGHSV